MNMRFAPVAAVTGALLLSACGTTATAPVESASPSGEVAGIFTKGVAVTVKNTGSQYFLVFDRDAPPDSGRRLLSPGETWFAQGDSFGADDVELGLSRSGRYNEVVDVDFSNPATGYPNASVNGLLKLFGEGTTRDWSVELANSDFPKIPCDISIVRESDSSDNKRFTMYVNCR